MRRALFLQFNLRRKCEGSRWRVSGEAKGLKMECFNGLLCPYYSQARPLLNLHIKPNCKSVKASYEMSYDVSKGPAWDRLPRAGRVLDIRLITGISLADPSLTTKECSISTAGRCTADKATHAMGVCVDAIFKGGAGATWQLFLSEPTHFPRIFLI